MAVWLSLVFDAAPVLGKLLPSLMVLVSFLDPPLCRGVLVAAMLLESLLAPTHGTVYSPTTLSVVMIIDLLEDSLVAERSRVILLLFSTCPLGINTMCTMSDCVLDSTIFAIACLVAVHSRSQVSNRRLFKNDGITNKTTSPWAVPLCAARNRPICYRR